jgi:hypothetical protein
MSCKRNHAAATGYALEILDGCQTFIPSQSNFRSCEVCSCHVGFHENQPIAEDREDFIGNGNSNGRIRETGDQANVQYQCQYCLLRFHLRKDLADHVVEFHPSEALEVAEVDSANGETMERTKQFMAQFSPTDEFQQQCPKCKKYLNICSMEKHLENRHAETQTIPGLECDFCGKTFDDGKDEALLQHVFKFHADDPKPYSCNYCGHRVSLVHASARHMKNCKANNQAAS